MPPRPLGLLVLAALALLAVGDRYASYAPDRHDALGQAKRAGCAENRTTIGACPLSENHASADEDSAEETRPVEYATFAVTLVAAGLLYWQSWETRRSANASVEASQSAAHSAELANELERPWLVPVLSNDNVERLCDYLKGPRTGIEWPPIISADLEITNRGRAPGWIIERSYALRIMPAALPDAPPYNDPPHCIVETTVETPIPDKDTARQLNRVLFASPTTVEKIRAGELVLVFYGYFKYRGILGHFRREPYESRFCWVSKRTVIEGSGIREYSGDKLIRVGPPDVIVRFEVGGPPGWTRYT